MTDEQRTKMYEQDGQQLGYNSYPTLQLQRIKFYEMAIWTNRNLTIAEAMVEAEKICSWSIGELNAIENLDKENRELNLTLANQTV